MKKPINTQNNLRPGDSGAAGGACSPVTATVSRATLTHHPAHLFHPHGHPAQPHPVAKRYSNTSATPTPIATLQPTVTSTPSIRQITPQNGTPPAYNLEITSSPPAAILIDGQFRGTVPGKFLLNPGGHRIEITKPGYETQVRTVSIPAAGPLVRMQIWLPVELPEYIIMPDESCSFWGFSPDHRWAIISRGSLQTKSELMIRDTQTGSLTVVASARNTSDPWGYFSPDGKYFVLTFLPGPIWLFETGHWDHHRVLIPEEFDPSSESIFSPRQPKNWPWSTCSQAGGSR